MGHLKDEQVEAVFDRACSTPDVAKVIDDFKSQWVDPLPPREITPKFCAGAVFVHGDKPARPLLPEGERLRALDTSKWQLSYYSAEHVSLHVKTFDTQAEAEAALGALKPDEYGEGGGVLFRGGGVVGENLYLKYMEKQDYVNFLERVQAAPPPPPSEAEITELRIGAVRASVVERLSGLTAMVPKLIQMHGEYKAKVEAAGGNPQQVRGRPSGPLIEFAKLFPQYVRLGGCVVKEGEKY